MGIASAVETAPNLERFFRLHRTLYTFGVLWIKPVAAVSGQLLICTCRPCIGRPCIGGPCSWSLATDQPLAGLMKISWIVLLLSVLVASCGGEGLSPERKACLESAKTEAERIACNNAAAIRADQEGD